MSATVNRERKLAVILHADIVSSTELVHRNETIAHTRITEAFIRFSATISAYAGIVREIRGDALVADFARASDAVAAALAGQAANTALNETLADDIRPQLRVGIALGEVVIADDTVTGPGIVLAQRLEQLAPSGGVCVQGSVYEAVPERMPFKFTSLGEREVKGFTQPVRAFSAELKQGQAIPAPEAAAITRSPARLHRRWALAVVILLSLALAGLGAWFAGKTYTSVNAEEPPALGIPRLSIVVLPFTNLSGDSNENYFADALTDDLTADLSRIAGSFVISRSTAATYRGKNLDPKRIASELNVRYLLEGNVRKSGEHVRVSVQLTDTETGQQVWSERYEKAKGDMYAFQNEVTGRIARTLNLELKDALSRQAARGRVGNLDADDLALRAWSELWTKPQSPITNEAALDFVTRSLEIDPDNAEAHGVAAYAYARAATYRWGMPREDAIRKGLEAGERAVALDAKNADAIYALAFIYFAAGDVLKSQEMLRQCIALNRNHAPAYFFYGITQLRTGQPHKAIKWVERAFALSPRDPLRSVWYGTIARAHVAIGNDMLAVETAQKGIAANPNHGHNYAALASASSYLGRTDEAKVAVEQFMQVQSGITVSRYQRTVAADDPTALKAYKRLLDGLREAGLPED